MGSPDVKRSKDFRGGQTDMVGGDELGLLGSCGNERTPGQMIGLAEEGGGPR
jgi:hypothetical protein